MLVKAPWQPILKDGAFEKVPLKENDDGSHLTTQVISLKEKEHESNESVARPLAFMNTEKNSHICRRGQAELRCFTFYKLVWNEDEQCYEIPNSSNCFVTIKMSAAENSMAMNEIAALQNLGSDHPNLLHCIEALRVDGMVFLITPYFQDISLFGFDSNGVSSQALDESQALHIFSCLLSAIAHLQAKSVCHLGITADNVAVGPNGEVLLVGFYESFRLVSSQPDLGEEATVRHHTSSTNHAYMPPEMEDFLHSSSDLNPFEIDIWAVCIVLFVMLAGNLPGSESGNPTIAHAVLYSPSSVEEILRSVPNDLVKDLLRRVFKKNPTERLSLQDIQFHAWLQSNKMKSGTDGTQSVRPSLNLKNWEGAKHFISKESLPRMSIRSPRDLQTGQKNTAPSFFTQSVSLEQDIRDNDVVLCGVADKKYKNHPGNLFWKEQINRYEKLDDEMAMVASENIVEQIEHRHCRFFRQSDIPGLWTVLLKYDAINKTYKEIRKQSDKNDILASHKNFSFAKHKHRRGVDPNGVAELKRIKLEDPKNNFPTFVPNAVMSLKRGNFEDHHSHSKSDSPITVPASIYSSPEIFSRIIPSNTLYPEHADKIPKKSSRMVPTLQSEVHSRISHDDIHEADVLFGGTGKSNPHPGNVFWKECCDQRSAFLSNSANLKAHGKKAAMEICEMVWNRFPSARFLQKEKNKDGTWIVLSEEEAIEKTLQMFRTGAMAISWPDQYAPFVVVADAARCVDVQVNGEMKSAWLMKEHDPKFAYSRIEERMQTDIEQRGKKLGDVSVCALHSRMESGDGKNKRYIFVDDENKGLVVTVKRFSRLAVSKYLSQEAIDDPLLEFDSSRRLDDDRYILRHLEMLKDENNVYIIEPYCNGGSMFAAVHLSSAGFVSEDLARSHFFQILLCLNHLQKSGICHHSLSPENIMLKDGKCVFSKFGQALRVPFTFDGKRQLAMAKERPSADLSFMAPEVFRSENFDGYATDLWSGLCVLYFMLTGLVLYNRPDDELYNYFVKEGLLWRRLPQDDSRAIRSAILEKTNGRGKADVVRMIEEREAAHKHLSVKVLGLFSQCFQDDPLKRGTLADVCYHKWVTGQQRIGIDKKMKQ